MNLVNRTDNAYSMQTQEEIYIDDDVMEVFERKSIDDVTITDKKIKAWIIQIKYSEDNINLNRRYIKKK